MRHICLNNNVSWETVPLEIFKKKHNTIEQPPKTAPPIPYFPQIYLFYFSALVLSLFAFLSRNCFEHTLLCMYNQWTNHLSTEQPQFTIKSSASTNMRMRKNGRCFSKLFSQTKLYFDINFFKCIFIFIFFLLNGIKIKKQIKTRKTWKKENKSVSGNFFFRSVTEIHRCYKVKRRQKKSVREKFRGDQAWNEY